ncbi:hypothetical protein [Actinomadura meridiana]|uniref:hypothetical protein n=1 Tax=Actinomadura meridiana TaxID=559626 RepID=UPI0031EF5681
MTTTTKRPPVRAPKKAPARRTPARPAPRVTTPAPAPAKKASAPAKTGAGKAAAAKAATRTAATRTTAKATAKTTAAKGTVRRAAPRTPPRAPFVLLIIGLLGGALVSLLLLNTVLAKDAFTLTRLQQSNARLDQQREGLEWDLARGSSPEQLSKMAKELGQRESDGAWYFSSATGRASGGGLRPVPSEAVASAGAAGVIGVPGTVVPGDGIPPVGTGQGPR